MRLLRDVKTFCLLCFVLLQFHSLKAQNGFSVDMSSGCAPIIVNFSYTEGGDPTYLSWDFGNSNTLNGDPAVDPIILNPSISYTTPGSYSVSLTVTTSSGVETYTNNDLVIVFDNPSASFTSDVIEGCGAFPVVFSDLSSSSEDPINQWNWDFGDGGSSTLQNPTHVYSSIGLYGVSLSVTTINGCSNTFSINNYITANDGVYPDFEMSDTLSCTLPLSVSFSNISTGSGDLTYYWDFGNGESSTLEDPTGIEYTEFGIFEVSLTVSSDLGCTQSSSQLITIQEFQVHFSDSTNCLPSPSFFYNDSDSQMNEFEWDFGDPSSGIDNSSDAENPIHTFSEPGTYLVSLTASINGECENTYSQEVNIIEVEEIDFSIDQDFICEFPVSIPINVNNVGVESFTWELTDFEDELMDEGDNIDNAIDFNTTSNSIADGQYDLSITVYFASGCISELFENDLIDVDLINLSTTISPIDICEGETVFGEDLTTYSSGVSNYQWDWGDGNTSTSSSDENTYDTAGNYTVSFSLMNGDGCTADTTVLVQVGIPTDPSFTYPDTVICVDEGVPFTYTGDTSIVDNYYWMYDWFLASNDPAPSLEIPEIDSVHTIILVTTNNGCQDTIVEIVSINALGPKAIFSMDNDFFCKEEAPYVTTFQNNSEVTSNTSYQWTFGSTEFDTVFVEDPGSLEYTQAGTYSIQLLLIDSVNGCEHEMVQELSIDNFNIFFEDSAEHSCDTYFYIGEMRYEDVLLITPQALNYEWDFGNGVFDITNPVDSAFADVFYDQTGSYLMQVNATNEYGCPDTVAQWVYVHPSPIAEFTMENPHQCPPYQVNVTNQSIEMDTIIVEYEYILNLDSNIYYFEENPVIDINQSGSHLLSLIITDGYGCNDLQSQSLHPYYIDMNYTIPPFLCYDTEYIIESAFESDFPPMQFLWEFGNDSLSTDSFPNLYIDNTQSDTLLNTVTVIDSTGCTQVDSFYIYISVPDISYSYQIEDAACPPMYTDFSIFSTDSILNYTIDYGDGEFNVFNNDSAAANISHVYDLPGNYDVNFMVTDPYGCTSSLIEESLIFIPGPWAEFSFSPNSGCPPLEVNFELLTDNNADELFWVFGDGNTSNEENPTHIYNLQGIYTPVLVLQDSADFASGDSIPCIISVQQDDIIIDGPLLDFEILEDSLCPGLENALTIINYTTSIPGFEINSYQWNYGDGGFSLDENPEPYYYDEAGTYSIILTVTTENGCEYTLEQNDAVTVIAAPEIAPYFEYTPTCPPMTVNFYGDATIFNDPDVHYTWDFGDGAYSNELNPIHEYSAEGIFYPSVALEILGCSYDIPLNETIETLPVPEAIIESTPVFANNNITDINLENQSEDASEIEWWINGAMLSNDDFITVPFSNQNLEIFLIASNEDFCRDTSFIAYSDFQWNISNILTPNGDGINDLFILNFTEFGNCVSLNVYNRWGRLVYENPRYRNTWTGRNMEGDILSDGTYFYIIDICSQAQVEGHITIRH